MRLLHFVQTTDYVKWLFFVFAKVGKGWLSTTWERFWNKKLKLYVFFYCIKQIDSILPCVCSVIDHRGRQNVVRTSVKHSAIALCVTFLFLPYFDVICDLLLNRRTATWTLFLLHNKKDKMLLTSSVSKIINKNQSKWKNNSTYF